MIEDVAIRNVQNGSNTQTDELKTDMGATGASMAGSLQQIAGDTGEIRKTSATTATQTGRTADNTLRSANTTDQIYGEVQYANQQLGDISDNTELNAVLTDEGNRFAERTANAAERGVDNSEIIIDHTQRAANAAERGNEFAERTANATETGNKFAERTANAAERGADAAKIVIRHTRRTADNTTPPKPPKS